MKKATGFIVLIFFLLSPINCVMITDSQYIIAHFNNHRDAYIYWRIAREKNLINDHMTLVHFDAHHDMDCMVGEYYEKWLSTFTLSPREVKGITNATFIDAAVNEGLISEIWWVMPDYMYWGQHFDRLETFVIQGEPTLFHKYVRFCDCQKEDGHIVCILMDVHEVAPPLPTLDKYTKTHARVHFVTLDMLPSFDEKVLLDVDTDYFINLLDIPLYPDYFHEDGNLRPWISVERVMDVLTDIKIRSRMVTIAVSPHYTHEEYHCLSWVITERIAEYLSEIYSLKRKENFSMI